MRSQDLLDHGGLGETDGAEAKWQKHAVVAMWVVLALFIAIAAGLFYGEAHGVFKSSGAAATTAAPWPDTMP